jgi:ribosome maturation factor RimP
MALDIDKIRALADRVAASHGLDVVEVEFLGNPKSRILRIFIEKNAEARAQMALSPEKDDLKLPENISVDQLAGITVDDCQIFSEDFGTVLDVEELVPGAEYTLEVSSPGLDRKLQGRKDFERFRGSLVKLRTDEPIDGNAHWQGRIGSVDGDTVELDLAPASKKKKAAATEAKRIRIPLAKILKANLVPEI